MENKPEEKKIDGQKRKQTMVFHKSITIIFIALGVHGTKLVTFFFV